MPIRLPESHAARYSEHFKRIFCEEVAGLDTDTLPLDKCMTIGSHVLPRRPEVMVLSTQSEADGLSVKAGVFFNSVIAGCNCADDPSPMDENNEYCELVFTLRPDSDLTDVDILRA